MVPKLNCDHIRLCRRHKTIIVNDVGSASVNYNACDTGSMYKAAETGKEHTSGKSLLASIPGSGASQKNSDSTSVYLPSTEETLLVRWNGYSHHSSFSTSNVALIHHLEHREQ